MSGLLRNVDAKIINYWNQYCLQTTNGKKHFLNRATEQVFSCTCVELVLSDYLFNFKQPLHRHMRV